jgi:5,10-methylenetetrahydromethanopterin reductase
MRFSYALLPDHPVTELVESIALADELGFYGAYGADETYHKDQWLIAAVAATRTRRIRLSPCVTHVILKEPTILAHSIATLDELSNGRAEAVYSIGNIAMLDQYHVDWRTGGQIDRLREAHHVMRTLLDDGKIDFEGRFYRYTGLFTSARPVQEHVPLKIGAMRGPKSFELAGEIADGMHQALAYSREAMQFATDHVRIGAERGGRDADALDLGAWMVTSIAEDGRAAKEAARVVVAFYIPAMPREQIQRHGIDPDSLQPIFDAFNAGDVEKAIALTTPDLTEKLSLSGSPDEWVERIRNEVIPTGFNHMICAPIDAYLVEAWSGLQIENVPDQQGQLRLIHDHVMPAFASDPSGPS